MKKLATIVVILLIVILGVWLWGPGAGEEETGTVVLAVTDAAANMSTIEKFNVTLAGARLKSEGGSWVDVTTEEKTFDLLELKAQEKLALLAQADVPVDSYDQVRLEVTNPEVVKTDGSTHNARIPSGELKLSGDVTVEKDGTSSVTLDFLADKSLHVTGDGEYIFTPVVKMETRTKAEVQVQENEQVEIRGGEKKEEKTVSMGADGRVKAGVQIPEQAAVEVMDDGTLKVTPGGGSDNSNGADHRAHPTPSQPHDDNGGRGQSGSSAGANANTGVDVNGGPSNNQRGDANAGADAGAGIDGGSGGVDAGAEAGASGGVQY